MLHRESRKKTRSARARVSRCRRWLGQCPLRAAALWGLVLAAVFEAVTCLFRFGLRLQATRDTCALARWTFGLRIHHAYPGMLLLLMALLIRKGGWRRLLLLFGVGLVMSDLAHHFAVLWPLTGDPQFHIHYPRLVAVGTEASK
jgi:hypothetical protein